MTRAVSSQPSVPWLQLVDGSYVVDAEVLAGKLGLTEAEARAAMGAGRLVSVSETGTGEDEGRTRLSFRHGSSVWRMVIEPDGTVSEDFEVVARKPPPRPAGR
ncbi:MAG: hypothetical protein KJZ80_06680 [Hyphomicrobiaceae bacterium]|nr:hypothetical protein [Hyphomicrobiaceae bacterium]